MLFCGSDGGAIDIDLKDKLKPAAGQFYRATYCQVHLPGDLVGNYENLRGASCEIQICSMMKACLERDRTRHWLQTRGRGTKRR